MKIAIALIFAIALHGVASAADRIMPPDVPALIKVPAGHKPILVGHAIGTQNYICAPTAAGLAWLPIGPQATAFSADLQQLFTHFQSKNPFQGDALHATWQHSHDSSVVWATKIVGSSDPSYVAPDAIEWLLLGVTGTYVGPTGGNKLSATTYIQRVNTVGGKAPTTDCTESILSTRQLMAYEADYYFYQ